jgi:hypothetical protein
MQFYWKNPVLFKDCIIKQGSLIYDSKNKKGYLKVSDGRWVWSDHFLYRLDEKPNEMSQLIGTFSFNSSSFSYFCPVSRFNPSHQTIKNLIEKVSGNTIKDHVLGLSAQETRRTYVRYIIGSVGISAGFLLGYALLKHRAG